MLGREFLNAQYSELAHEAWLEAKNMLATIHNKKIKNLSLTALGKELIKAQQWDQVRMMIPMIGDQLLRSRLTRDLALELTRALH